MAQTQNSSGESLDSTLNFIAEVSGLPIEQVKTMYERVRKGRSLAEAMSIPPESLEAGYALACNLFSSGKYHDAETMYRVLCQYDANNPRNWLGLGCCLEKQGLYREAVFSLAHAAELGYPINPKPLYLLAQCCCSIQDTESAKRVLEIAVTAGDEADAEQMSYRKMSQELLANLV